MVNTVTGAGAPVCPADYPDPGATKSNTTIATGHFLERRDGVFSADVQPLFLLPNRAARAHGDAHLQRSGVCRECIRNRYSIRAHHPSLPPSIRSRALRPSSGRPARARCRSRMGDGGGCHVRRYRLLPTGAVEALVVNLATGCNRRGLHRPLGSLEFAPTGSCAWRRRHQDGGNLYLISTVSGAATLVGPTGYASVTGLTFASQPLRC